MSGIDLLYIDADVPADTKEHETNETIYEWYPWSYFNVIFGFLILGFIAIFFSFRTTTHKQAENYVKARLWSRITLIWNILTTSTCIGLIFYAILRR